MNRFEYRVCPLCGSTTYECVSGTCGTREFGVDGFVPKPVKCKKCCLVYLNPTMSEEYNKLFYSENYQENYVKHIGLVKNTLDTDRRVNIVRKYSDTSKVIDVGCGNSDFIRNFDGAIGIDLSAARAQNAKNRGLNVLCGSVFDFNIRANTITLFHVLEHINNPVEFLTRLREILSDDGSLIIEVPVLNDALLVVDSYKKFYYQAAHCNYFTIETLSELLKKCGFGVSFVKKEQRYSLSNHLCWAVKGHGGKIKIPKFLDTIYAWMIKTINKNDTVSVVCKKR